METDGQSGDLEVAVEAPADDYVLHSEEQAKEAAKTNPEPEKPETEAAKLPETPEGEEGESSEAPKKMGGFKRKLLAKEAEIAELRKQLEQYQKPADKTQKTADFDKEPSVEDYDNVLDYVKATQKWEVAQALKEQNKAALEAKEAEVYQERVQDYTERLRSVVEQNPDVLAKIEELDASGLVTPVIERAVIESPVGEKLTLHFTQYPADLEVISQMPEKQMIRIIGQLEARLMMSEQPKTEQAAVRITKAPAPVNPVRAPSSTSTKSLDELPYEEYVKVRNKQERDSRR